MLYKHIKGGWAVFGRTRHRNMRLKKVRMIVGNPPNQCKPVWVIDGETYVILLEETDYNTQHRGQKKCFESEKTKKIERGIIGQWKKDNGEIKATVANTRM